MSELRIDNARIIDPANGLDETRSLHINDGKISASTSSNADVIDASGLLLCPGFIDLYARLREPGYSRKGTIETESRAALKAGFTTVFCSPDTNPVIDSTATVELIKQKANAANGARVIPIAALTNGLDGERLSEMATLFNAGCRILGHGDRPIKNTGVLVSAMEYAASFDIPIMIRPIDDSIAGDGCAHAGAIATRLGLPGLTVAAETVAIAQLIELCRSTGCRLHLSRLSSARAIELVRQAKNDQLAISADVGIHHLYFSHEQIKTYDVNFHSAVPFRSLEDRDALRQAVKDGTLDAICSDHAPHDNDSKLAPFPSSEPGLSAFDGFTPLLMALPELLGMPLIDVIAKVTTGPESIVSSGDIKKATAGSALHGLSNGVFADLVLLDPKANAQLSESDFLSQGLNSPLVGVENLTEYTEEHVELRGSVKMSFINGRKMPAA